MTIDVETGRVHRTVEREVEPRLSDKEAADQDRVIKDRITDKGNVLVSDDQKYIQIDNTSPFGSKCILINKSAGVAYIGVLQKRDKFPTHYYPLPTF